MPVYEYECKNCGQRFDKIQPVTSEALTECLLCGKGPIRRVFQPVGVIFKGSGWYSTDNRNSNKSNQASGSGGESRSSAAGSDDGKAKADKSDTSDKTDKSDKSESSGKSSAPASKSSDD